MNAELPARAVTLGRLLHAAGGSATVTELREQAGGVSQGTAAKAIGELTAAGLVERVGGTRGTPRLTAAGLVRFAGVEPVSAGEVVDAAAAVWPYTHAAFLRLYLAAVVARHHLGPVGPHLGFVAIGEPRTGKSALYAQACHLLGLDADTHTRELALMTAAEITGRRSAAGAAVTFTPAGYLARPAVLLDEFDKAPAALRERAQKVLLQGKYRTVVDDEQLEVRCAPMLAGNLPAGAGSDRFAHVHQAYRTRRSVLLDSGALRGQLTDLGPRLSEYYASHPAGELDLARLVPPAATLPSGRPLWESLRSFLAVGRDEHFPDERALDLLALGYAALRGVQPGDAAGLDLAAIYVVLDWHACASTVPGLVDQSAGTPQIELTEAHHAYYGGRADLASLEAAIAAQRAGADARAAQARATARARVHVQDGVLRGRGELAEALRLAAATIEGRKVPDEHKPAAAGLRDVLGKLRTHVQQLTRTDHLDEARDRAAGPLREAHALAQRIAAERTARVRDQQQTAQLERQQRADAKTSARQQQAAQRQYAKHAKQQARQRLTDLRQVLTGLEKLARRTTTAAGDNPLTELRRLQLVSYRPDPTAEQVERPRGWWKRLTAVEPMPGEWVARDGTSYPGSPGYCHALASWGPATRAVITAALRQGYAEEDGLCAQLGLAARVRRLDLDAAPVVTAAAPLRALPAAGDRYGIRRG